MTKKRSKKVSVSGPTKKIIGIDPGLSGALALVTVERVLALPMPVLGITKTKKVIDEGAFCAFLEKRRERIGHVFIEKVGAMPGQGVTSMFNFGLGWGLVRGICVGLHLPYTLVMPQTWKKVMCHGMPKGSKDVSIIIAKRLWPGVNLFRSTRCKNECDGMADALLIAEYGRRLLAGG